MAALLALTIVCTGSAQVDQQHDVLGGPCADQPHLGLRNQIQNAEKAGAWDRAVALQKQEVRDSCAVQYIWYGLVDILLKAHRPAEASMALQAMDSRGFEINPALIAAEYSAVATFIDSKAFRASPLGMKIERLEQISDERRARFQQQLHAMPASAKPPENYVAKNACPFECCRFGKWIVLKDTNLVATPGSTRIVGTARKGSAALALTGEVHLIPQPVVVLIKGDLPKDSIAFVLENIGEGYGHVYTDGKVVATSLSYATGIASALRKRAGAKRSRRQRKRSHRSGGCRSGSTTDSWDGAISPTILATKTPAAKLNDGTRSSASVSRSCSNSVRL